MAPMAPAPTGSRGRNVARARAAALRDQAAEMRRSADRAQLQSRREIYLRAARRFVELAVLQDSIAERSADLSARRSEAQRSL